MQQKCDQSANLKKQEIQLFCRELLHRPEPNEVFHQYSSNSHLLSTVELRKFLNDQGEDNTIAHTQSLILTYDEWAKKNQLNRMPNGFTLYMLSRENDVFNLEHTLASPYPLILSLENHCSVEQQTIMARQLRSILGDKLLTKPLNDQLSESLPSPEGTLRRWMLLGLLSKLEPGLKRVPLDLDYMEFTFVLNFQTDGEQMDLNRGRFLPNGHCGYLLKPSFLCQLDSEFNPENTGGGPGRNPTFFTIRVISAQQLPKPGTEKLNSIVDPMVWVETHGAPIDNNKKKTHRINNNVYRHVRLLKADGSSLSPASLFIHVKVTPNYSSSERAA
ncbi:hypothetical protein SRHO_G00160070 [Serrasalmus rhombeus]